MYNEIDRWHDEGGQNETMAMTHIERLNEFRGFNPKYDEALDGLIEQFDSLERLRSAVVNAAMNGENEYIRSWCNLALAGAGIEPSIPAKRPM